MPLREAPALFDPGLLALFDCELLAERVAPEVRELPDERELLAVLEPPEDREAPAVLLFEAFAVWACARVDCGLRFGALAGLDDERLDVLLRLVEPRSLTADISTPPIRFTPPGASETHGSRSYSEAYPLRSGNERPGRMSQQEPQAPGQMF